MDPAAEDRSSRYDRQELVAEIGREGQDRIRAATVVVVGCGALGTHAGEYLARAGVGRLRLVDRDLVDWSNLQRQIAFGEREARDRTPKALALARRIAEINAEVEVDPRPEEIRPESALELCGGADLILDGTDNVPARFLLNDASYSLGIPWIYGGVLRSSGMVAAYAGTSGPCFRCTFPELPVPGSLATCATAGVLGAAVGITAGAQGVLALRILAAQRPEEIYGRQLRFDAWRLDFRTARIRSDPSCPVCRGERFEVLEGHGTMESEVLCGRRAVQIRPAHRSGRNRPAARLDLPSLARRLAPHGPIEDRGYFVRLVLDECVLTVFRDGRAIFDGLTDPTRARSLYDLLIGE